MLTTIQKLLLAFVTLIVGLVLIGSIATSTIGNTSLTGVNAETVSISNALNAVTTNVSNVTHGTYFSDNPGAYGTYVFPTIIEADGKDLACTQPVVTNATSGTLIAVGNWSWATASQARGRCGIVINATTFPDPEFNNSRWNFTYTVTYSDINSSVKLSIAQAPTGWKAYDCPINTIVLTNGTTVLVQNTDYTYTSAAQINLLASATNNFTTGNNYKASYNYCGDSYISGWGGTVLNLVPGFFALALLIFSVGMFYSLAKDAGIL
jgi:hypothetical protein